MIKSVDTRHEVNMIFHSAFCMFSAMWTSMTKHESAMRGYESDFEIAYRQQIDITTCKTTKTYIIIFRFRMLSINLSVFQCDFENFKSWKKLTEFWFCCQSENFIRLAHWFCLTAVRNKNEKNAKLIANIETPIDSMKTLFVEPEYTPNKTWRIVWGSVWQQQERSPKKKKRAGHTRITVVWKNWYILTVLEQEENSFWILQILVTT